MDIEILFFGPLTDIVGLNTITMANPCSIDALKVQLFKQYPKLADAKFIIAINNKMVMDNEAIPDNAVIALMPPFSGG